MFTGGYDVDGNLVTESWPSGITVAHSYDETGTSVGITYDRPGCGASDCTLYSGSVAESVHGQWRHHASTLAEQTYTYDASGRLTTVEDTIGGQCTTRAYGFSASSNRTSLVEYAPAGDGACQTGTAASTITHSYDAADRITTAGTVYDALGRTTTVPAADTATPAAGNATVGYHVTDLVDTITQAGRTVDYALDVTGERIRSFTDTADGTPVTTVHHYDDDGDNPAWTQENVDTWTRIVSGVSGMGGIWNSDNGQVTWRLTNLHGDLVATILPDDAGLSATTDASEYGTPRNPDAIGGERYGWLGAKQRASDPATGLILMGVRLYNTTSGRFLTTDPVYGGSCNAYEYTCADPLNKKDLDGKRWCWKFCGWGRNSVWRMVFYGTRMSVHIGGWVSGAALLKGGFRSARSGWKVYRAVKKKGWKATFHPFRTKDRWKYIGSGLASWVGYHDFKSDWRNFSAARRDTIHAGAKKYCRIEVYSQAIL
ncbi:RHS repeat-associated core domain-containing protein [Solwaraspora sp. WMMB335]|uniref:RHS repeat-associated core domain-containing protein n=1 Tax=Solwaraspora sp. WMMB335 TaxID=3404118 RepID=UPI003B9630B8